MKALMLLGAIVGFLIGSSFALAGRSEWPAALWKASAAALGAGLLMRWWGRVWMKSLQEALLERRAAQAESRHDNKASPTAKV